MKNKTHNTRNLPQQQLLKTIEVQICNQLSQIRTFQKDNKSTSAYHSEVAHQNQSSPSKFTHLVMVLPLKLNSRYLNQMHQ